MTFSQFLIYGIPVLAVAIIGSLSTDTTSAWYQALNKPSIQPSGATFGIVWTILYILIAFAGYFGSQVANPEARTRIQWLFWIQLVLNLLWTIVFFQLQNIILGLVVLSLLFIVTLLWTISLLNARPEAGVLVLPYLLWLGIAWYLNYSIWMLNYW